MHHDLARINDNIEQVRKGAHGIEKKAFKKNHLQSKYVVISLKELRDLVKAKSKLYPVRMGTIAIKQSKSKKIPGKLH